MRARFDSRATLAGDRPFSWRVVGGIEGGNKMEKKAREVSLSLYSFKRENDTKAWNRYLTLGNVIAYCY